jgi:hypothetical protein
VKYFQAWVRFVLPCVDVSVLFVLLFNLVMEPFFPWKICTESLIRWEQDVHCILRWVHACNFTAYHNTVSWQCGQDSWPRNVSKVGYLVTLWACLVCYRCLAVASKGWYGYGLSRSVHAMWHVTTVRSYRLLAPITNWEPHYLTLAGYCYAMRHRMKVKTVTQYRVSHF